MAACFKARFSDRSNNTAKTVMRSFSRLFSFVFLSGNLGFAYADYDLLLKSNCLACHNIDKRKYGPILNEVAEKYANDEGAAEMLAKRIRAGGSGVWGEEPMPPQPQVSKEDALALAKYILSLK